MKTQQSLRFNFILLFLVFAAANLFAADAFMPIDVLSTQYCSSAEISPDGAWIAYTVRAPRTATEDPGGAYSELYLISVKTGEIFPYITGKVNVSQVQWHPTGEKISFVARRADNKRSQVWLISTSGGEATQVTDFESGIYSYRWHPSGEKLAFISVRPDTKREQQLDKKGYGFIFYEENLKHRNIYVQDAKMSAEPEQLTDGVTIWDFEFSPDGKTIAASVSPENLIDHRYMFRKIYVLDVATKKMKQISDNEGKLGNYAFSPDGSKLAFGAAKMRKDHQVSQAYVVDVSGGKSKNLTPPNFRGHVNWVNWKDNNTIIYRTNEGVWNSLSAVKINGGERTILLNSKENGIIFGEPSYTKDFKHFAFVGSSPEIPADLFYWQSGKKMKRLTNLNPWIAERTSGKQTVVQYQSRDSVTIEGLLIYPVDYKEGARYPLVVFVHGGPEANYSNSWLTRYSTPGQVMAGKGYVVFYPNYRASTGYGLEYALAGYEDAAGKEFDDIADGIDYLIGQGLADRERVGLGGGSYGGYAAAWFSSYYTKYVDAVCMFVGISDLISKRGTTDIPYEELYVHSGLKLEEMWEESLKRSPIYYAHQSETAVLILGGTADTRVHPSQSLEYYRRLKMNNHPAVRLVQYPGEGHGNARQPGRIDVLYRVMQWYDWYVKDDNPLDGPMPPLDISKNYGLELDE